MGKLTKEQAELGLKWFAIIRSDPHLQKMNEWLNTEFQTVKTYEEFKTRYPSGSLGLFYFNTYYRYNEILGDLVYEGLIPVEFVLDALGGAGFSDKMKMIAEGRRKDNDNPLLFEHWQWLSQQVSKCYNESKKREPRYK